jgi:phosphatidate cytidylyltransferase
VNSGSVNGDMARWPAVPEAARNLAARAASAVVLGSVFIAAVLAGGAWFAAIVIAGAMASFHEWSRLTSASAASVDRWGPLAVLPAPPLLGLAWGPAAGLALIVVLSAAIYALFRVLRRAAPAYSAFGLVYIGVPALSILWLRDQPEVGLGLVLWFCATIWVNDIAAYASGRTIGGPRLAPSISPAKTWAGFAGGVAGAVGIGALASWLLGWGQPLVAMLLGGGLAGIAQLGDLFESAIKRQFGVKDSSGLIPGHGGLLDRMDGFLAAAPMAALIYGIFREPVGW